jgi:hypothetical protein
MHDNPYTPNVVVYSPAGFEYRLNVFRFVVVRQQDVREGLVFNAIEITPILILARLPCKR